jgi:hypothetical protein
MKSASATHLELLQSRLDLLHRLIRMQQEWRGAFVRLDLENSERCSADQQLLCDRMRVLDQQIASTRARALQSGEPVPVANQQLSAAIAQTEALHMELQRSNQTNLAILKRSKFTINALRNLFNSLAPTYASPAAHSTGTIYEEVV